MMSTLRGGRGLPKCRRSKGGCVYLVLCIWPKGVKNSQNCVDIILVYPLTCVRHLLMTKYCFQRVSKLHSVLDILMLSQLHSIRMMPKNLSLLARAYLASLPFHRRYVCVLHDTPVTKTLTRTIFLKLLKASCGESVTYQEEDDCVLYCEIM